MVVDQYDRTSDLLDFAGIHAEMHDSIRDQWRQTWQTIRAMAASSRLYPGRGACDASSVG